MNTKYDKDGARMVQSKRQAFIGFCKTFFNQPGIDEQVFEDVKIEEGTSSTYTITFTIRKEFIRELPPEVLISLETFRHAQAYSPTGEVGEVKTHP